MNKYIKKGLRMVGPVMGIAIYTMNVAFGQPADPEKIKRVQQKSPTQIAFDILNTLEQKPYTLKQTAVVYEKYMKNLRTAKVSGVDYKEVKHLNGFLNNHLPYMKSDLKEVVNFINKKRKDEEKTIEKIVEDSEGKKEFNQLITTLKEKVLAFYPELGKENSSIKYNANSLLNQNHNQIAKELILESCNSFNKRGDNSLLYLNKKEQLTIQDLLAFYSVLNNKQSLFDTKKITEKQREPDIPFMDIFKHKKAYENFLKDIVEWRKQSKPLEFISLGVIRAAIHEGNATPEETAWSGFVKKTRSPNDYDKNLEKLLNCELNKVKEKFPIETKIPVWLGMVLAFGAPFAVKGLVTAYTKRKWDGGDGGEAGFNAIIGGFILDGFHPLVFPIRVFGLPLAAEVIRRLSSTK